MAVSLTHTTAATGTDSGDGKISKNAWNEAHTLSLTGPAVLGNATAGAGAAVELTIGAAAGNILDKASGDTLYAPISGSANYAPATGSANYQPLDADLTAIAALATTVYGRARLTLADAAELTAGINLATTTLAGAMSAADKIKLNNELAAVKYDAVGTAQGNAIADYFTATLSLDASSIYEIEAHAYFLKTTAGTVIWTWTFSSAPTMATSRYQSTPISGFTTTTITGAEIFAEATAEAVAAMAHAVSGSLTTAVRHSFIFTVRVRTNLATTIQLRSTQSAGTLTPQPGSYMRARKIA